MHYIVDFNYPKFEWTYDVPYMLLPLTTMQYGRVFPEEKKKLNNKINKQNLDKGNVTFNLNTTSSFPRECPVCLHDVGAFVSLRHTNTQRIYWHKLRLEMKNFRLFVPYIVHYILNTI